MGLFFKRYDVEIEVKLADGDTAKGRIDLCGTFLSNVSDIQQAAVNLAEQQMGSVVTKVLSFKYHEV
jgi:hypothetical protein